MSESIANTFSTYLELSVIVGAAVAIGGAALLAWCGFRLAAKLTNRGVGK